MSADRISRQGRHGVASMAALLPPVFRHGAVLLATLLAFTVGGCSMFGLPHEGNRIDIVILATDLETRDALLARMQNVESISDPLVGRSTAASGQRGPNQDSRASWYRGEVQMNRANSRYAIRVGMPRQDPGAQPTMDEILQSAAGEWSPRYVLVLGTAEAVANEDPLGAVGMATLICNFDLGRFVRMRDPGICYRADGGLMSAVLSLREEWALAETRASDRRGCPSARVVKMAAISGPGGPSPDFNETINAMSEELHRGLIIEREGVPVAETVEALRHRRGAAIGMIMLRGIRETHPKTEPPSMGTSGPGPLDAQMLRACAARDTADFAVELIRNRWPVSPRASR